MPNVPYAGKPLRIATGAATTVQLPPRVLRARLVGFLFETDKTFVLPSVVAGIRELVRLYGQHATLQVLVTGHTDTQGSRAYNLGLSCERADSVADYLQSRASDWLEWYSGKPHSKKWGAREDQYMLSTVTDGQGAPYYGGPIDGDAGPLTIDATKRFQGDHGLAASGTPDEATRTALVTAYMALEGTTLPADAHVETHGCGQAHLAVPTGQGVAEPRNRRVEVFLFEGPIDPPAVSPCPASGCDGYPAWVASSRATVDLDQAPGDLTVRVEDEGQSPVPNATVRITSGVVSDQARTSAATTGDDAGTVSFKDLIPDEYTVTAESQGFAARSTRVTVVSRTATSAASGGGGGDGGGGAGPASGGDGGGGGGDGGDPKEPKIAPGDPASGGDAAGPVAAPAGGGPNQAVVQLASNVKLTGILAFASRSLSLKKRKVMATTTEAYFQFPTRKSADLALASNPPIVLPRGIWPLIFEAATNPPNQPVQWAVVANGSNAALPTNGPIEGNRKLGLQADQTGAFAVTAKVNASDKPLVFNVVFVDVQPKQSGNPRGAEGSTFTSLPDPGRDLGIHVLSSSSSSSPAFFAGLDVTLADGGLPGDTWVNKIKLKLLQNGTATDVTGTYVKLRDGSLVGQRQAKEELAPPFPFPVVDTDDLDGTDANRHFPHDNSTAAKVDPAGNEGRQRHIDFFDAPACNSFKAHWKDPAAAATSDPDLDTQLGRIDGEESYVSALAAISTDSPDSIAIFAAIPWRANFSGTVELETRKIGETTLKVPKWSPGQEAGVFPGAWQFFAGGLDPSANNMEVWPPNYLNSEKTTMLPQARPDLP